MFGSWAVGLGMALLLRTDMPFRRRPQGAAAAALGRAGRRLRDLDQLPGGHRHQPDAEAVQRRSASGQPLFLADPTWAKILVCIYKVWVSFPFMMLMASAALASVDETVYEAARMDGAGPVKQFRYITLPIIARPTYISWILMTIFCVNDFPTIFLLTGGGPINATTSLVVLAYRTVFQNFQVGPGCVDRVPHDHHPGHHLVPAVPADQEGARLMAILHETVDAATGANSSCARSTARAGHAVAPVRHRRW